MEDKHYTMAELMEEFEKEERERAIREEEERLAEIARKKQERIAEKERKYQEYLAEKERKHQEYLAEKERRYWANEDITCKKCGTTFTWTEGEKKFYRERGFHKPTLCKECKANQKMRVTFHK